MKKNADLILERHNNDATLIRKDRRPRLRNINNNSHHPRRHNRSSKPSSSSYRLVSICAVVFFTLILKLSFSPSNNDNNNSKNPRRIVPTAAHAVGMPEVPDGLACVARGEQLFQEGKYDEAAVEFWKAVLVHGETPPSRSYDVAKAFQQFMACYQVQGRIADGFCFVAVESFRRGQHAMGNNYYQQCLASDPDNEGVAVIQQQFGHFLEESNSSKNRKQQQQPKKMKKKPKDELHGKTAEALYEIGATKFAEKSYEECADVMEISCERSSYQLGPSCANAVYCRNMIMDWGFNGTQFDKDMRRIADLTREETKQWRYDVAGDGNGGNNNNNNNNNFAWQRSTSVHPHMMLGYPLTESILKRYATESVAFMDELLARASGSSSGGGGIPPLPDGLPFDRDADRIRFASQVTTTTKEKAKIRVGFVGSGFNSKAVLYLSQDMFRFFDPSQFEIHIFSFAAADDPLFIKHGMRGVDWRERVQSNVDYFWDCEAMKMDHITGARFIHDKNIHILIEWDGYARQGERAQGLFALRPAPVQMLHQEFLGTSGAQYVDYIFSDRITSPPELDHLYTEKIIYMPNHFFSKGHAMQAEVKVPTYKYLPKTTPYRLGAGSPQENRCLAPDNESGPTRKPSFVYCNFNKFLKNNPETVRSWIRILREVPNSMLCLLENPEEGVSYLRKFVHEAAGTSSNNSDPNTFEYGDGDELNRRIHFLKWEGNPFDHQMRNKDFCNVMLDSYPYNGHTVAQDALYGGVPIVTRSDGKDMCSRVTTSANTVLGLEELNAYGGPTQYEEIAIKIGNDKNMYRRAREKLIDTCLQRNPMHPYWDVARYVKNFEVGLKTAWETFLAGEPAQHINIEETEVAAKGTFDKEIRDHPPEGKVSRSRPGNSLDGEL